MFHWNKMGGLGLCVWLEEGGGGEWGGEEGQLGCAGSRNKCVFLELGAHSVKEYPTTEQDCLFFFLFLFSGFKPKY